MKNSKKDSVHLVLDIGNTNSVFGIFKGNRFKTVWRINTRKDITVDEAVLALHGLLEAGGISPSVIKRLALASVVPSVEHPWVQALKSVLGIEPEILTVACCSSFRIAYDFPDQIGADRLANVLACQSLGMEECVVVDMGTATTFDVYSERTYWGGIICPGVHSSLTELVRRASKLADVHLYWNDKVIGKNTDDALRNGVLFGTVGQIGHILSYVFKERNMKHPEVLATGGLANLIAKKIPEVSRVEKNLTLLGLNHFIREGYGR